MTADPLKALFLHFEAEPIAAPALFLNGVRCEGLPETTTVQQCFKPLAAGGIPDIPDRGSFATIMILGTRQHDETRYMIARALDLLAEDGLFVCAAANDAGGKRLKPDLQSLGLDINEAARHKSRVVWTRPRGIRAPDWLREGAEREILNGRFVSQPGLFGWDRIDEGSALLAETLPEDFSGAGADFGCGYGFLTVHMLTRNPAIKNCLSIDADSRAVRLCEKNAAHIGAAKKQFVWHDLTRPLVETPPLDWIVMNPPFHEGKKADPAIGQAFIRTAAPSLKKGGSLWMVANAHLPYEQTLAEHFTSMKTVREKKGFKICHAVR